MHIKNESKEVESQIIQRLVKHQSSVKAEFDRMESAIDRLKGEQSSLSQQHASAQAAIAKHRGEFKSINDRLSGKIKQVEGELASFERGNSFGPLAAWERDQAETRKVLIKDLKDTAHSAWVDFYNGNKGQEESRKIVEADLAVATTTLSQHERQRLYEGILHETQIGFGLAAASALHRYAGFAGSSIDAIFVSASGNPELHQALEALTQGTLGLHHLSHLVAEAEKIGGTVEPTPEQRALKQFINHVVMPHQAYFDVVASFADDVRAQGDLGAFPPLEILNHKPISLSGRRQIDGEVTASPEQLAERAAASTAFQSKIQYGQLPSLLKEASPLMEKLTAMTRANETEINSYAGVFHGVERAVMDLENKRAELEGNRRAHTNSLIGAEKANSDIENRIREMDARNQAKQDAATAGSMTRGSLAVAAGIALAMFDGGTVSSTLVAHGAKELAVKTFRDAHHSLTYSAGQHVATKVENAALADYMQSLRAQKVNLPALKAEIEAVEKAIAETAESKQFQEIMQSEAKRSYVAETLLQRSLIRNGYNNASDLDELAREQGLASVDAMLEQYQGTRLGLALQKHCHGIADSNDMRIILVESDCLRGQPDGADAVLREYVEGTMKPNIGAFLSKASKMDVVRQANLTGYGTDLHFPAEIGMENNRAVRILLANEFGMSVVGRNDVRDMFDFWLHRYGDRQLYDDKIRDGEMTDEYPDKRVSHISAEAMGRFVDMAKRSVESGRASFPKVGNPFLRMCAFSYFKPQAVNVGGKDNIFTDHPESSCAYPCVNDVVREFIGRLSFSDIGAYRAQVGERLDNVIASSFFDFFQELGKLHNDDAQLVALRGRVRDAANYDDYRPVFDRYAKTITRDAMTRFDMFLEIYRTNLEAQMRVCGIDDRAVLTEQVEGVKHLADGKLNPPIVQPGSRAARLQAHEECFTGENLGVFARR